MVLARQFGQDDDACREAGLAGLLHDLGKAMLPIEILNKPGKLTGAEFDIIKSHPARGHEMLVEGRAVIGAALEVCLHHHERPEGGGYPHGLSGDAVTPLVRLASGKPAVVIEQNAGTLVAPVVKVYFSTRSQMHVQPRLLDLFRPGCADRIIGRESPARPAVAVDFMRRSNADGPAPGLLVRSGLRGPAFRRAGR